MSWVTVAAESRKGGSWIRRGLAMCALMGLIGLPVTMVSCSGDDNGGGGGGGGNNPPPPTGGANQFAYVISPGNTGVGSVQAYRLDGDGNLTAVGSPVATGSDPHHVDVDPRGRFVYVSNHESPFLSGYRINQDGSLTPMNQTAGSPVTGLGNPPDPTEAQSHSSVPDQTGQFLYVIAGPEAGAPSTLKAYRIDTTPGNTLGNLTALTGPGSSFPVGIHAHNIALSPNNQFVYVATSGSGEVYAFSRDTSTGALTPSGPAITGLTGATAVTVDPQSRFAYVAYINAVEVFRIENNGALARVSTFDNNLSANGSGPHSLTMHPNGQFLYVANINSNTITVLRIDPNTGDLTDIQSPRPATGGDPNYIVVHPNQRFVFTADASNANNGNKVSRFTINPDGTLTAAGNAATFPNGSGTNGIGTTKLP